MSSKLDNIIDQLKTLTLLEASELVASIEKTFGVDASGSIATGTTPSTTVPLQAPLIEVEEEKTAFDIYLVDVPADKKMAILKLIRSITGLGLKESKSIVDEVPKLIKEGSTKEEAESIKKDLEGAGAKVLIK